MSEWNQVKTETWKEEEGESVEGILINVQGNVGRHQSKLYTIEKNGKQMSFWGSKVLDDLMLAVAVGQPVKVEFNGTKESTSGGSYKSYTVYTKDVEEEKEE